jgi:hypothetical protein
MDRLYHTNNESAGPDEADDSLRLWAYLTVNYDHDDRFHEQVYTQSEHLPASAGTNSSNAPEHGSSWSPDGPPQGFQPYRFPATNERLSSSEASSFNMPSSGMEINDQAQPSLPPLSFHSSMGEGSTQLTGDYPPESINPWSEQAHQRSTIANPVHCFGMDDMVSTRTLSDPVHYHGINDMVSLTTLPDSCHQKTADTAVGPIGSAGIVVRPETMVTQLANSAHDGSDECKSPSRSPRPCIAGVSAHCPTMRCKPLTAYNYFYRNERDNIVNNMKQPGDPLPPPVSDFTPSKMEQLLHHHWYEFCSTVLEFLAMQHKLTGSLGSLFCRHVDPMKRKRRHVKTHGKINFPE